MRNCGLCEVISRARRYPFLYLNKTKVIVAVTVITAGGDQPIRMRWVKVSMDGTNIEQKSVCQLPHQFPQIKGDLNMGIVCFGVEY
jgi:hypothetical protein